MSRAVIDQPGWRVAAAGLFFALVLGLTLRSQISPERVEASLQRSVQILEKDFLIDFDTAEVRLSKWGLPLPHLVISKIRLSPKKIWLQNSQIYIDELEIPLPLQNIFTSEQSVDFIRARTVEVRLADLDSSVFSSGPVKNRKKQVMAEDVVSTGLQADAYDVSENKGAAESSAGGVSAAQLFSRKTGTRLKEIAIDELKIITAQNYDQPLMFKQFKVFLDYQNDRLAKIDLKSRLYYIKDIRSDIYFLISDLNVHIAPEALGHVGVTLQLKGRLLDGDIQAFAQGSTRNQKLSYEISTRNVSLKAYTPLINRRKKESPFDKWPLSTSFYMVGEAQVDGSDPRAIFKFKNFDAVGENMKIDLPEINVEFVNRQTLLRPFQVNLNHIPLAPLKIVLADQFDFQSVENLGVVNGLLKFEDHNHWSFDGDIKKTELIFSNRGSREIEVIDSVGVNLDYQGSQLKFNLANIVIHQNEIRGGLEGLYSKDPKELRLKLDIEGQVLNERIWRQLTQVVQNPSIKLNWSYRKANEERHQIKINSPELGFPGLSLSDVQIDFVQLGANDTKSLALSFKTARTEVRVAELKPHIARAFFNAETELNESTYAVVKPQVSMQGSDWKNMNFDLDVTFSDVQTGKSIDHLKARGEWKSDSSLTGAATLQNPKRVLKYNLLKRNKNDIEFMPVKKVSE